MKVAGPHAHSSRGKSTACSRGTLREQSSSVCTNDFMGILHLREQNFHPAKCSTIFNRFKYLWASSRGKLSELENAPLCVLTCAKWAWSMLQEQNPSCVSPFTALADSASENFQDYGIRIPRLILTMRSCPIMISCSWSPGRGSPQWSAHWNI